MFGIRNRVAEDNARRDGFERGLEEGLGLRPRPYGTPGRNAQEREAYRSAHKRGSRIAARIGRCS
jgi:hypothetical protein